jgi:hypothetical protein
VAAAGGVVARRRRGRAVVRSEFTLIPAPEERGPRRVVVRVEPGLGALLVTHALEDLIDGGVEGGAPCGGGGIGTPPALRRQLPGVRKSGGTG